MSNAAQQEERNKRIAIIAFAVVFVGIAIYAYESFFASAPPPPTASPTVATKSGSEGGASTVSPNASSNANASAAVQAGGLGVAPGVAAQKMASTSSSLDPTLDESAMLRTESLVYAGTGRNIFSMMSVAAPVEVVKVVPPARPGPVIPQGPVVPPGPPPPPPINLKFFGTEQRTNAPLQAFISHGDDIYLASPGDIVARMYKILKITEHNIQVEDLSNQNTQTLPLQAN